MAFFCKRVADIVVATPGRLGELLRSSSTVARTMKNIKVLFVFEPILFNQIDLSV